MNLKDYISELDCQFATGKATEHTYRPALQNLLAAMLPHITVSNEPARQECGAPDYILQRKQTNIPVAFIEAKDLGEPLDGRKKHKEQFDRYKHSLDNLIFTDYLDFWLYEKGEFVDSVRIAEQRGEKIVAKSENFEKFGQLIAHFGNAQPQKITSSSKLAEIMAGKARLLAAVIEETIEKSPEDGSLAAQMEAFKEVLIHTITPKEFADVYAQTIAYGMFAARLHDQSPDTFSRQEAATLIPKTNPFLRQLFQYIAGFDLDERISWIVDDLAESFRATDIKAVMKGFGERTQQTDPMIHFYEDFLSAYDPALRKSRGVWYTPQAVVNFIVRAVDEILQTEFVLPMGLANTSKTTMKVANQKAKKRDAEMYELDVHRVQILDPATGTGTFLAEVINQIYEKFQGQTGMWQGYVEEHLIPRLNGFELLMASYTMAHLKLDLLLGSTGYVHPSNERLRVFLTNSLEEHHPDTGTLWAQWLANEANGANRIKRDTPVMVVMGNPPYSGISSNNGEWISRMIDDYKYVDKVYFNERKHWLNDDYVKFMRLGQYFVDKNAEGVLAYINNHSFIDNPTFRGMRWNLMKSFDKIYIIDLHGNSKKKEVCPDGSPDQNVFDIQQGVSINIFVKTGKKAADALAEVYHYDLFGKRDEKYDYLLAHGLSNVPFVKVEPTAPFYFMLPKNEDNRAEYERGFRIDELFSIMNTGICSQRDSIAIQGCKNNLKSILHDFETLSENELRDKHSITKDGRDWKVLFAKDNVKNTVNKEDKIQKIEYRIFDTRYTFYTNKSKGFIAYPRYEVFRHLLNDNLCLLINRTVKGIPFNHIFVTKNIPDLHLFETANASIYGLPLYVYPTDNQTNSDGVTRRPNFKPGVVRQISQKLGLEFEDEKSGATDKFAPIDLLDYIYAVLHSPSYRETYKEFLKIDFPRIPYPQGETPTERAANFRRLAALGSELRQLHLMEHPALKGMTTDYLFLGNGNNTVEKLRWELSGTAKQGEASSSASESTDSATGRVWINPTQYFDGVPLTAWEFYIGGYQPAQKWLKDRDGRTLSFDDIMHYQKMITALCHTHNLMNKIS